MAKTNTTDRGGTGLGDAVSLLDDGGNITVTSLREQTARSRSTESARSRSTFGGNDVINHRWAFRHAGRPDIHPADVSFDLGLGDDVLTLDSSRVVLA